MALIPTNDAVVTRCASWDEFVREVRKEPNLLLPDGSLHASACTLFRGHFDPGWPLCSKLERNLLLPSIEYDDGEPPPGPGDLENWYHTQALEVLARFRRSVSSLDHSLGRLEVNELWALGRHHGLLTPLLDWSESPYVAAYFAFEPLYRKQELHVGEVTSGGSGDVRVWVLRMYEDITIGGEFEVVRGVPPGARRQNAQRGVFTKVLSAKHRTLENYLKARERAHFLQAIDIPKNEFATACADLTLMNITPFTLFPDLDGAAIHANIILSTMRIMRTIFDGLDDVESTAR